MSVSFHVSQEPLEHSPSSEPEGRVFFPRNEPFELEGWIVWLPAQERIFAESVSLQREAAEATQRVARQMYGEGELRHVRVYSVDE